MKRRPNAVDLTGQVFGYLTVLRREGTRRKYALWRCRCTCGKECLAASNLLKEGRKKSCALDGHYNLEYLKARPPGITAANPSEHSSWQKMWERCTNPNHERYKYYGARGITICEAWKSFPQFLKDLGQKPTPKHTVDRIDNDKNYEPANCKWSTRKEQSRNRQTTVYVEHEGKRVLLIDLVAEHGVTRSVVYGRLKNGWPLDRALLEPVKKHKTKVDTP